MHSIDWQGAVLFDQREDVRIIRSLGRLAIQCDLNDDGAIAELVKIDGLTAYSAFND